MMDAERHILSRAEREEVEELLRAWRRAITQIAAAGIKERTMLRMLRAAERGQGDPDVLRRPLPRLSSLLVPLRAILDRSAADRIAMERVLSPPALEPAVAKRAKAALRSHDLYIRDLNELWLALNSRRLAYEWAAMRVTRPVIVIKGDKTTVRKPRGWNAGRVVEELKTKAKVSPKNAAVVVAIYEAAGCWPVPEDAVQRAAEDVVVGDTFEGTFERLRKAHARLPTGDVLRVSEVRVIKDGGDPNK